MATLDTDDLAAIAALIAPTEAKVDTLTSNLAALNGITSAAASTQPSNQ